LKIVVNKILSYDSFGVHFENCY